MAKFDFDSLTLGEVSTIEDLSGYGIGALNEEKPQGKFLAALLMVAKRRDGQPTFTFNAALAVTMNEAQEFLGLGEDDDADAVPTDDTDPAGGTYDPAADAEGNGDGYEPTVTD